MYTIDKKTKTGTIVLNAGHALILGHKPEKLGLDQIIEKQVLEKQDTQSLGLFDNSTPNYTTYYPDVTAADLTPKEDEFIYPVFRMLSETILSKGVPIDFGKQGVLKKSMQMMVGQTINVDHETALGNAIGVVTEVQWQNSYKTSTGLEVPAGFNATLKIDGKSNPRIARGIMMSPPSIHSNSVTVRFGWEPSHTFEDDNEFYQKLGTYDKEGELVRLVVGEIKQYSETSLVAHGADPYAQKIGADGKILNPGYADNVYSFSEDKQKVNTQFIDYKDSTTWSFKANTIPKIININNKQSMKTIQEILAEVEEQFSLESGTLSAENFSEELATAFSALVPKSDLDTKQTQLETANDNITRLEGELETANTETTRLKGELETANSNVMPENLTQEVRDEAIRLAKLVNPTIDEALLTAVGKMDLADATAFKTKYQLEVDEKLPLTCGSCQSIEISRASASVDPSNGESDKVISNSEAKATLLAKKKKSISSIAIDNNQ